jgi:hypothetical protein
MATIKYSKKGFSLLDVIFAIGICMIGLVGILGLLRYVILAGRLSADRFVATNLAEEGIELVIAFRDNNWLSASPSWNQGLSGSATGVEYQVQYKDNSLTLTSDTPLTPLRIDAQGFYNYDSGTPTIFTRRILIYSPGSASCVSLFLNSVPDDENFCVVSEVTWQTTYGTASAVIEDRLFNWNSP